MIFIRKHGNQIAEHMGRRRKAVQQQNGGSIPGTSFAIEDFQLLHVKRAIENGRRNRVRHLTLLMRSPPCVEVLPVRPPRYSSDGEGIYSTLVFPEVPERRM